MQNFYIKKGSTEPLLKMKLVEDGRNDMREFYERLVNATITFSMKDPYGVYKIYKSPCGVVTKKNVSELTSDTYFIYYLWKQEDVDEVGTYEGEFEIRFYSPDAVYLSNLVVPIKEKLSISIL
jgi:hypothetical protein